MTPEHSGEHIGDHIDIGTSQLGYRAIGTGPDVVFVHGWPLHRETWRNVVINLPDYRCHLIDLPGCGASITPPSTAVSLGSAVDAVVAAVKKLGLERFTLVGHDSGGLVARFAAALMIESVDALVVAGTEIPHHHPALIERLQKVTRLPGAAATMSKLLAVPRIARSNHMLGGLFHNRDLIEGTFRSHVLEPHLTSPVTMKRQLELLASYSTDLVDEVEAAHAKLTCPTLMIWGDGDPFFPVEHARSMADQFAGPVRFEVIANAKLLVHEEHPQRFAELCAEFLSQL